MTIANKYVWLGDTDPFGTLVNFSPYTSLDDNGAPLPGYAAPTGVESPGPYAPGPGIPSVGQTATGPAPVSGPPPAPTTTTLATPPPSPTAFKINITWDASVSSAPAGFTNDVIAAVQYVESQFNDPVTVNIDVGYGEIDGQPVGVDDLGESDSFLQSVSYSQLLGAVDANAGNSATAAAVAASLPASSPLGGANYWLTTADAKALGLAPAGATGVDGDVGFAPASSFTYGDNAAGGAVAPNAYDFFGVAVHEITEVMGRSLLTGKTVGGTGNDASLMDLLHYSAPGARDTSGTTPGYFSPDGGVTNDGEFNTIPSGDFGDWADSVADNPFDAFDTPGVPTPVTPNDITVMNAIGWNPANSVPAIVPQTIKPPTGVSFVPVTSDLNAAQGASGLNADVPLLAVSETGGTANDQFIYTLSGASGFGLTTFDDQAMLETGAVGVAGGVNGHVYNLAVTATDETAASHPSAASPVNIVVGSAGNDVINLNNLPGIAADTPTFIYGLSGNDTINGTGMNAALYFVAGTGAETFTGGAGFNYFGYGSTADSTTTAMDIINNFNVTTDFIDFTGLGAAFTSVAAMAPGTTAVLANSIGWQVSAGETFVYVNTTNATETTATANMKILLAGDVALTASNFIHH